MYGSPKNDPGRIVLTILDNFPNPSIDTVHSFFSKCGLIEKLIIFTKEKGQRRSTQCLIQFQSQESAEFCIENHASSYQMAFSTLKELTVKYNNDRSWDYTNPKLPGRTNANDTYASEAYGGPLPLSNSLAALPHMNSFTLGGISPFHLGYAGGYSGASPYQGLSPMTMMMNGPMDSEYQRAVQAGSPNNGQPGHIVIVYNLSDKITLRHLFNLFSVYGYIEKIKMLHRRNDAGMIQYRTAEYAELSIKHLNGIALYGNEITVQRSYAVDLKLEDSTTNYLSNTKEYVGRDQRWPANAHDKIMRSACGPTTTLQLSFLEPSTSEDQIKKVFKDHSKVTKFQWLPKQGDKFNMALLTVDNLNDAINCVSNLHFNDLNGMTMKVNFTRSEAAEVTA